MLIKLINSVIYLGGLLAGLLLYIASKKTPSFGYKSMIHLFCITGGRSNDWLSTIIGILKPFYDFSGLQGVLGDVDGLEKEHILSNLRKKGYHVFDKRLSDEICNKLLQFALSNKCNSCPMDGADSFKTSRGVYPRDNPKAVRYEFTTEDLLTNVDFQSLISDMTLGALAQEYLGARPIIDVIGMWWHTGYSDKPDMQSAQYYHFDMDRPKWLKYFIYLTDVTSESGSHMFIEGSHLAGGVADSMLKKGYARLSDEEVDGHYGRDKVVEFVAPRGTIIAEDTRGLHKGKHVKKGDRLILQIQFSNSLFGASYSKLSMPEYLIDELKDKIRKFPNLYSAYR